jgi:Spy/CpxP family protein refolding chaperone
MNFKSKLLVLITCLALAGGAFARDHGPRPDRGHLGMGAELVSHLTRALRRLDLSEDQKEIIHADLQDLRESMKPLVRDLRQNRKALHEQITAADYDANAVTELATRQGSITAEMTIIASEVAAGVLASLTDEQRAELKAMAETRRAHRKAHRDLKNERRDRHEEGAD